MLGHSGSSGAWCFLCYLGISAISSFYVAPFQVDGTESYLAMFMKVLPLSILVYCMNSRQFQLLNLKGQLKRYHRENLHLATWVKWAFFFGIGGDFFMFKTQNTTWFMFGMAVFSVGHICFIHAFGFKNVNKNLGIGIFIFAVGAIIVVVPGAPDPLRSTIPFYVPFLVTMVWRAIDRASYIDGRSASKRYLLAFAAVLFAVSDLSIGLSNFVLGPEYHYEGEYFVLATYYMAQGLIAVACS